MPRHLLPHLLLIAALAACAPTQEWVNPVAPLGHRDGDMRDCNQEADYLARRQTAFQRDMAMRDAYYARRPGDRALANSRLHQIDTLAMLDRRRFFERCMETRGYRLRDID